MKLILCLIMFISAVVALFSLAIEVKSVLQQLYVAVNIMSCSITFTICVAALYTGRKK